MKMDTAKYAVGKERRCRMPLWSRIALFAFAFELSTIPAPSQTIPELAKSHPSNPVVRGRLIDVPKSTMQDLVSGATVILDATLTRSRSYLTANQEDILTDYEIVPNSVLAGSLTVGRHSPGSFHTVNPHDVWRRSGDRRNKSFGCGLLVSASAQWPQVSIVPAALWEPRALSALSSRCL